MHTVEITNKKNFQKITSIKVEMCCHHGNCLCGCGLWNVFGCRSAWHTLSHWWMTRSGLLPIYVRHMLRYRLRTPCDPEYDKRLWITDGRMDTLSFTSFFPHHKIAPAHHLPPKYEMQAWFLISHWGFKWKQMKHRMCVHWGRWMSTTGSSCACKAKYIIPVVKPLHWLPLRRANSSSKFYFDVSVGS